MRTLMWCAVVSLAAVILLASPPAMATQVQYLPIETLGNDSPVVVRGQVNAVRTYWNDARTRILTETTIRVTDAYKGAPGGVVRVVQMGGELDGVRMTVSGALAWSEGEDVLLFLEDSLPGRYRVAGFSQGKFGVQTDPRTGEEFVVQAPLGGIDLVDADAYVAPVRRSLDSVLSEALPQIDGGE